MKNLLMTSFIIYIYINFVLELLNIKLKYLLNNIFLHKHNIMYYYINDFLYIIYIM